MADGGGGSTPQQTTQTTTSEPWSEQKDYLKTGFSQAKENVLDRPLEYAPFNTVVQPSQQTQQALQGIENRAISGNPLNLMAQKTLGDTVQGNYLQRGNPNLEGAIEASVAPVRQEFTNTIRPSIQAGFSNAGRYGSNAAMRNALDTADNNYMRTVGGIGSQLAFGNYENERKNQLNATSAAPGFAAQDYADLGQLANVGQAKEAQQAATIQDQLARWQFDQTEPNQRIAQYMGLVGGNYGGTQTSTGTTFTPQGSGISPLLLGLGGLGLGAASMFGGGGASAGGGSIGSMPYSAYTMGPHY